MPKSDYAKELKLHFPDAAGGPNVGPSDAGAEHFAGNLMAHLARECAQNAIDARRGQGPVLLRFGLEHIPPSEIPEFEGGLTRAWDAASKWWGDNGKAYPHVFTDAKSARSGAHVPVLVISDFMTKGLEGISSSSDEAGGSWTNLVKSTGVANSSKGAGGAFGIGKMAPFACSTLRTVFYQTCSKDGWGFQGVVRLMTHRDENTGRKLQAFGMIGLPGHDKREDCEISLPVTSRDEVPNAFRRVRSNKMLGTDIFVIGFSGGGDWKLHVKTALVANFFPAINDGYAEFDIDGEKIDKHSLLQVLSTLKRDAIAANLTDTVKELEHTYWYIKAREACIAGNDNWKLSSGLAHFGEVRMGVVQATKDDIKIHGQMPSRCFMCRSNRMKIFAKSYQLSFPFAAFMICDHEAGNELLRRLEPPTHTAWEKDRDKSRQHAAYAELTKIYSWIRGEIAKLAPPVSEDSLTLESVARAIRGLDSGKEKGSDVAEGNDAEKPIKKGVKHSPFRRVTYSNDSVKLPKLPDPGNVVDVIPKKYKALPIQANFVYRGECRYVVKITPLFKGKLAGDEILQLSAVNFSGSLDKVAFELVGAKSDDLINLTKGLSRIGDSKLAPISIPSGHEGQICFSIKTEISLLSLTAQILQPIPPKRLSISK